MACSGWLDQPTGRVIRRIEASQAGEEVQIELKQLRWWR